MKRLAFVVCLSVIPLASCRLSDDLIGRNPDIPHPTCKKVGVWPTGKQPVKYVLNGRCTV